METVTYAQAERALRAGTPGYRLVQTAGDAQGERPRAIEVEALGIVLTSTGGRYTVEEWDELPSHDEEGRE